MMLLYSKYSRDLITMLLYSKYSRDLIAMLLYNKNSRDLITMVLYSMYSRDLIMMLLYSKNYGWWMIMKLSGMLQKKSIIPQGFISSGRDLARFAHFLLSYRVTHKRWDFKDDCSEFIKYVFLHSWFPVSLNLYFSLLNLLIYHCKTVFPAEPIM